MANPIVNRANIIANWWKKILSRPPWSTRGGGPCPARSNFIFTWGALDLGLTSKSPRTELVMIGDPWQCTSRWDQHQHHHRNNGTCVSGGGFHIETPLCVLLSSDFWANLLGKSTKFWSMAIAARNNHIVYIYIYTYIYIHIKNICIYTYIYAPCGNQTWLAGNIHQSNSNIFPSINIHHSHSSMFFFSQAPVITI